jgi:hypothetical protein
LSKLTRLTTEQQSSVDADFSVEADWLSGELVGLFEHSEQQPVAANRIAPANNIHPRMVLLPEDPG